MITTTSLLTTFWRIPSISSSLSFAAVRLYLGGKQSRIEEIMASFGGIA